MWFAQTPTPPPLPPGITVESLTTSPTFTTLQLILLGVYFTICLSLIVCVTLQTSKSEGLMQQSMAAPSQPSGKGKMTGDERLANLTTNLAYLFLGLSIIIAYVIKI
jgi:protein translocase SecG subunit